MGRANYCSSSSLNIERKIYSLYGEARCGFQQDNAHVHAAKIGKDLLSERGVFLIAIEEVFALIRKWLSYLRNPPTNLLDLEEKIHETWKAVCTSELCRSLLGFNSKRLSECVRNNGAQINH